MNVCLRRDRQRPVYDEHFRATLASTKAPSEHLKTLIKLQPVRKVDSIKTNWIMKRRSVLSFWLLPDTVIDDFLVLSLLRPSARDLESAQTPPWWRTYRFSKWTVRRRGTRRMEASRDTSSCVQIYTGHMHALYIDYDNGTGLTCTLEIQQI